MIIISPANERLKHARRVRDGREPEWIFVEGERLVEECLRSGLKVSACFHLPEPTPRAQAIIDQLESAGCPLYPTIEAVLATISDTVNGQGLIVLAERPRFTIDQAMTPPGRHFTPRAARSSSSDSHLNSPLIVCLDSVQDPGNFGAIIRTAEAAGASGVLALKGSVDAFAPKTLRSAMGSAFRLPVISDVQAEEVLARARAAGIQVAATAADADLIYSDFDWTRPALVVFGNEARGVNAQFLERCDLRMRIPLHAPVESINVAAAAAVIVFEAARQRRAGLRSDGCEAERN
jgi:TrmH family RNA methyltransferase